MHLSCADSVNYGHNDLEIDCFMCKLMEHLQQRVHFSRLSNQIHNHYHQQYGHISSHYALILRQYEEKGIVSIKFQVNISVVYCFCVLSFVLFLQDLIVEIKGFSYGSRDRIFLHNCFLAQVHLTRSRSDDTLLWITMKEQMTDNR